MGSNEMVSVRASVLVNRGGAGKVERSGESSVLKLLKIE